jgi:hypothetical protein
MTGKHTPLLVIDVGGSHVKIVCTGDRNERKFVSGPDMTAKQMVAGVLKLAKGWKYHGVSIGYPGAVLHGRPVSPSKAVFGCGQIQAWRRVLGGQSQKPRLALCHQMDLEISPLPFRFYLPKESKRNWSSLIRRYLHIGVVVTGFYSGRIGVMA